MATITKRRKNMVTIIPVKDELELFLKYDGQINPQDTFVELDCDEKTLTAKANESTSFSVPESVFNGCVLRFPCSCLKIDAANALLDEALSLAQKIVDGYKSVWDGSNWKGKYTAEAQRAITELKRLCWDFGYLEDLITYEDAKDYYSDWEDELGVTANTTDEELEAIADELRSEAEVDILLDLDEYLRDVRNRKQEEGADD
jgi:hypothetical protein